jgi:glycine cleavage system H protein
MVAIFVLTAFLFLLAVDFIVLKIRGKSHPAFEPSVIPSALLVFERDGLAVPPNIFISKGHTWIKKINDGLISVGIDSFGASALGKLKILKCAEPDKEIKRGEMIFEGGYGDKKVKFLSPIDGTVKFVNTGILGKIISNPYETWGVQIYSEDTPGYRDRFLSGSDALNWMKKEFLKLNNFIDDHLQKIELAGATMYDGGSSSDDFASSLDEKSTNDFEQEFLSL